MPMVSHLVDLEPFTEDDFATLISWVKSPEELMQFAGPEFSYPLTEAQLYKVIHDEKRHPFKVTPPELGEMIGYAEVYMGEKVAYLSRLLIADPEQRGKGLGTSLVYELLDFAFMVLAQPRAVLNVSDGNKDAIRCYEKAGFVLNPNLKTERTVNGKTWTLLHMSINRADWIAAHGDTPPESYFGEE